MKDNRKANLILTLVIVLAISALIGSFLYVVVGRIKEAYDKKASAKAFYIAEAGINKAMWYLITPTSEGGMGQSWRVTASIESFSDGYYTFSILDGPTTGSILLIATGETSGSSKTVQQILTTSGSSTASFEYGVYSASNLSLSGSGKINGPVFSAGNVTLTGTASINGSVKLLPGGSYTKNGVPQPATIVSTAPPMPTIDRTPYDELLSQAAAQPPGDLTIGGSGNYYLNGGTLYVNGNLNITGSKNIRGGGTIVVTGNISISGSGTIDPNTKIIAGNNLSMTGSNTVNSGSVLFAGNNIDLSGSGDITGSVIAMNQVDATGSGRTIGLVYSQSGLSGSRTIVGAVVCRTNANFVGTVNITFNPSVISITTIPGLVSSSGGLVKAKGGWKEKK